MIVSTTWSKQVRVRICVCVPARVHVLTCALPSVHTRLSASPHPVDSLQISLGGAEGWEGTDQMADRGEAVGPASSSPHRADAL